MVRLEQERLPQLRLPLPLPRKRAARDHKRCPRASQAKSSTSPITPPFDRSGRANRSPRPFVPPRLLARRNHNLSVHRAVPARWSLHPISVVAAGAVARGSVRQRRHQLRQEEEARPHHRSPSSRPSDPRLSNAKTNNTGNHRRPPATLTYSATATATRALVHRRGRNPARRTTRVTGRGTVPSPPSPLPPPQRR